MSDLLESFIADCRDLMQEYVAPADIVLELSPKLLELMPKADAFLSDAHRQPDPEKYARNAVYACPEGSLSLFAMVWEPGQWTPVHDHGTWGVVGVVDGVLEERNFIRVDDQAREDSGIVLRRGGNSLLTPGTVTTFVPNPDHIHRTGVPRTRRRTVTLHLYGRQMNNYNVYDLELGRRYPVELTPNPEAFAPGV
jgi:predicted metal-dependent enzyme (double-stranded beta helix superfamily)